MTANVSLSFTNGDKLSLWDSFSLRESFMDPLGSFNLSVSVPKKDLEKYNDLLVRGARVTLRVNDVPQATMLIQTVTRSISKADGIKFKLDCQSVLATAYEASVDYNVNKSVKADKTVDEIILEVMGQYGFEEVNLDADQNVKIKSGKPIPGRSDNPISLEEIKERDLEANPGETAYGFCSRILSRIGAVMHVDVDGKLLITRPNYDQDTVATITEGLGGIEGSDRAIGTLEIKETNRGQFSEVVVIGQKLDTAGTSFAGKPIGRVVWEGGPAVTNPRFFNAPTEVLPGSNGKVPLHGYLSEFGSSYKPKFKLDKKCRDVDKCTDLAAITMYNSSKDAYQVRVNVFDFVTKSGHLWNYDTMVRLKSSTFGLDQKMWVLERTFTASRRGSLSTQLVLIPEGALDLRAPSRSTSKAGAGGSGGSGGIDEHNAIRAAILKRIYDKILG